MPSQKPRLNLTLDDELSDVLAELSQLMGVPKAKIVTDILEDAKPVFIEMRDAFKSVKTKKEALPYLARISATANAKTALMNSEMAEFVQEIDWNNNP